MAGSRKKQNNRKPPVQQPQELFYGSAEELPRADLDTQDKMSKRQKIYRAVVMSSVFLLPAALLANTFMAINMVQVDEEEPPPAATSDSPHKSVAMTAVRDWLANKPQPIPGGSLLSWDSVQEQRPSTEVVDEVTGETNEQYGLELHELTILAGSGSTYETSVQIAYTPNKGAHVVGEPTLVPRAPDNTDWTDATSWPDLAPATATQEVTQAVSAWVDAFTSGDPDTLRLNVGDTEAGRSYVPLSGVKASNVAISMAAAAESAPVSEDGSVATPSEMVARVSFNVLWDGQSVGLNERASAVSYDVLIHDADTAAPRIVAWGGPGTGASLTPFQNAVEGRAITAESLEAKN